MLFTDPAEAAGACSFQDPRLSVFFLPLDWGGRGSFEGEVFIRY
jgi:hypothetical protein